MEYSIPNVWFITPWARSVLIENQIDGLVMDTTWDMIGQSVTAMLMAVFYNVGILLALAFGPWETKELYALFSTSFADRFQINSSNDVLRGNKDPFWRRLPMIITRGVIYSVSDTSYQAWGTNGLVSKLVTS
jgi:hypothetical protein